MVEFVGYFVTSAVLVALILIAVYIVNMPSYDYSKHSAYECGFEPFGDARGFFDVHFYTIGILFIIFDLEIVYLVPFVADITSVASVGYGNMIIFMCIVLVGFYYEWVVGLLNWVPKKSVYKQLSKW